MLDPHLGVRPYLTGWNLPTTMAFLSPNEFFVLEKDTGKVQYVLKGDVDHTVLDLAVNNFPSAACWGLLWIPNLHPITLSIFIGVVLPLSPSDNPFIPSQTECADTPELGADSGADAGSSFAWESCRSFPLGWQYSYL